MDETLPGPIATGYNGALEGVLPGNGAANMAAAEGGIADNGNATSCDDKKGDDEKIEMRMPRKDPMKVYGDRRHAINQRRWLNGRSARGMVGKQELEFEGVLREYFDFLDPEGTGAISVEELEEPLLSLGVVNSHSDVCALISLVDKGGTGVIEFKDFVRIVKSGERVRDMLQAMAQGDVGCRDLNFDICVAQHRRQQMMSALVLDSEQAGEKERARKLFHNWVAFLERHAKLPESTVKHNRSLFGGLKAAAEVEASAHANSLTVEAKGERSREMVSLRRRYARKRQRTTADMTPVAQCRCMAAFCSAHFSTLSLIFHAMNGDLNVEQNVIGRREFQTALRQLAVADVQQCPVQLTTETISALWSMLDTAHCSVTCLSALEKGLARVAGPEALKLSLSQEENHQQESTVEEEKEEENFASQEPRSLEFAQGDATPSLGLSSIHSSFFNSPQRDGSPVAEPGPVEELQHQLCPSAFNSSNLPRRQSTQSAAVLSNVTGQGDETSPLIGLPDDFEEGPPFRRAVELANQGLGCATKLVRDRHWHHTNFKGVDEVLSARAPAAPWLYQTSMKPPTSGHFMEADFVPVDVSASDPGQQNVTTRDANAPLMQTSQSSLAPFKNKFSADKSIGEESTRSTVGQGVAELQAQLDAPWFNSDPAALHGKLSMSRQTMVRPGGRPSALRSVARSLIMTPRGK